MVGAVIVRDNQIVGRGWHRRIGGAHAEIEALRDAGDFARGATMYVTLEPCNHHGRTPPCTDAVLAAGIARVVVAVADPNPSVRGGGINVLRSHGLSVAEGPCEEAARELNRGFFTWARCGRPFITLKAAMTLDGRLSTHTGHSQWISGPASRRRAHLERAAHDAVLVGIGTALADNPRLDVRVDLPSEIDSPPRATHPSPRRIVLDSTCRLPLDAEMCGDSHRPPLLFTTARAPRERRLALTDRGVEVVEVALDSDGRVALAEVLPRLAPLGVTTLLVEGGGLVNASFLRERAADRVVSFVAPRVVGGTPALTPLGPVPVIRPSIDGEARADALRLARMRVEQLGDDLCIEGHLTW